METVKGRLKVFLCHANENKPIVKKLYDRLKAAGYDPWLDSELMFPGMNWDLEIQKALQQSDAVIICLSSTSITKEGYFQKELKLAQNMQDMKPADVIFLIPLRLDNSELPFSLRSIQWGDYTAPDGFARLVHALNLRAQQLGKSLGSRVASRAPSHGSRSRKGDPANQNGPTHVEHRDEAARKLHELLSTVKQMRSMIPPSPYFEFGDDTQFVDEMESQLATIRKLISGVDGIYSSKPSLAQRNLYYDVVGAFENLQKFIAQTTSKVMHSTRDTKELKSRLLQLERAMVDLVGSEGQKASPDSAPSKDQGRPRVKLQESPPKSIISKRKQQEPVDVVILTVLEDEYLAVCRQLQELRTERGTRTSPNLYAWRTGTVFCEHYDGTYRVAVGMTGRAGNPQSVMVALDAITRWKPRYVFFTGIAGGLIDFKKAAQDSNYKPEIHLGDIVIGDIIHGYEYGKIEGSFHPRDNWTYSPDQGLLTTATAYKTNPAWRRRIKLAPPRNLQPNILLGEVASGDKVIDDPTNAFFAAVYEKWPKTKAVEMEGAGVAAAINQARDAGKVIGFLMIRGISDIPRSPQAISSPHPSEGNRGTQERDNWKPYAAEVAAAVTVGLIADGLPVPPKQKS